MEDRRIYHVDIDKFNGTVEELIENVKQQFAKQKEQWLEPIPGRDGMFHNNAPVQLTKPDKLTPEEQCYGLPEAMPCVRNSCHEKAGSDGLKQNLKPITEMPLEQLDQYSANGAFTEVQKLAGLYTNKRGSFQAMEDQIEHLEKSLMDATKVLTTLKMELGWLKKLSAMKW